MISKRTRKKGGGLVARVVESKVKRLAEKYSNKSALNNLKKKYPIASRLAKRVAGEVGKHSPKRISTAVTKVGKITKNAKSEIEKYLSADQIETIKKFRTLSNNEDINDFKAFLGENKNIETIKTLSKKLMPLIGPGKNQL